MRGIRALFIALLFCNFVFAKTYSTGLKIPLKWKEDATFSHLLGVKVPETWDWREKVKKVPLVKNQGSCGSCWAFATSSVMEWVESIANVDVILSPQELVSCDKTSFGCGGGFFTAFDYEVDPGLALEKDYPYTGRNGRCKGSDVDHKDKIASWGYVGNDNRSPTPEEIMAQIYTSGPVAATVCASGAFMNYRGGVFNGGGSCQNHMITLVGFDANEGYFILQNSWGKSWGEDGYMKIKFGAAGVAQIAAFAVYK